MIGAAVAGEGVSLLSKIGVKVALAFGVLAVIGVLVAWAFWERARVSDRDATIAADHAIRDKLTDANVGLAESLDRVQAFHAIELAALTADRDRATARAAKASTLIRGISNAPTEADGPVSRVLLDAVNGLRRDRAASDLSGPGRAPDAAGGAAVMPGQPGTAGGNP